MKTCRICHEPVIFVVLFGWTHVTFEEFDHKAEVGN